MAADFHSIVDPFDGTATVYFFRDIDRDRAPAVTFTMTSGVSWHKTGKRPFHWDYLEPNGDREYGIIMLAVSRTVRIEQTDQNLPDFPIPGVFLIIVQVYRLQNDDLLPDANDKVNFQRIAGQPIHWFQYLDPYAESIFDVTNAELLQPPRQRGVRTVVPTPDHATIQPTPRGVRIDHHNGNWFFEMLGLRNEPTAFAFDVGGLQVFDSYTIRVVYSDGVELRGGRVIREQPPSLPPSRIPVPRRPIRQLPPFVQVLEHKTGFSKVPPQGTPLADDRYSFQEWDNFEQWLSPSAKKTAIIIETVIGFIPYVGAIYDIAQLAYAATTGKNFWGETMHEMDYAVLAVVAVLPVAFSARQLKPALQSLRKSNRLFSAALSETTTTALTKRIDKEFIEALKEVPVRQQEEVVTAVESLAKGTGSAKQVLTQFDNAVRTNFEEIVKKFEFAESFERHADRLVEDPTFKEAIRAAGKEADFYSAYRLYKAGHGQLESVLHLFDDNMVGAVSRFKDEQRLLSIFTDDFKNFRVEPFKGRYATYLGKEKKTLSAVQWAKSQTTGRYRDALVAALGKDYVDLINKTLGERFVYEVSDAQRAAFFRILGSKLRSYDDIRRVVKKTGLGRLFEVDHLLEKRFSKSVFVGEEVLDEGEFAAILVPKNPAVAVQLPEFAGGYAHSVKTQMLRELIPHGKEDLFTIQQWWDAHAYVLRKLGADPEVFKLKFAETFADVAHSAKQPFLARFDQTEALFAPDKWLPRGPKTTLPIKIPKRAR